MDNPVTEISGVVHSLTQTTPSKQRQTIFTYFTPNASFTHPFCRTGSWERSQTLNSRLAILYIYRWYKILSPRIDLQVNSIAYDAANLTLYLHISQTFRIWFIPFYAAPVSLVTVLKLAQDKASKKYLIRSQEDLYQTTEFARFAIPLGHFAVIAWQLLATLFCVLGAVVFYPQTVLEERLGKGWVGLASRSSNVPEDARGEEVRLEDWKREWNEAEEDREMREFRKEQEEMKKLS